jgi:L-fuculose-phosphate aldolase
MQPISEREARSAIVEIGRRLYAKGHVVANDGNVSCRLDEGRILTTPSGVCKGFMQADELVLVSPDGTPISGGRPSSELPMHLFIYRERPDIRAVVHAHPPYATGFSTAGQALERCVLAEVIVDIGAVPLAEYGTPSTEELPQSLRPFIHSCEAFLLANHGVVTLGRELFEAYYKMERVEHFAKIVFIARHLGGERVLPKREVEKLFELRQSFDAEGVNPGCAACLDECIGEVCVNYEHKHDPEGRDRFNEIVEQVLAAVR